MKYEPPWKGYWDDRQWRGSVTSPAQSLKGHCDLATTRRKSSGEDYLIQLCSDQLNLGLAKFHHTSEPCSVGSKWLEVLIWEGFWQRAMCLINNVCCGQGQTLVGMSYITDAASFICREGGHPRRAVTLPFVKISQGCTSWAQLTYLLKAVLPCHLNSLFMSFIQTRYWTSTTWPSLSLDLFLLFSYWVEIISGI